MLAGVYAQLAFVSDVLLRSLSHNGYYRCRGGRIA